MRSAALVRLFAALFAVALFASACGDDDADTADDSTTSLGTAPGEGVPDEGGSGDEAEATTSSTPTTAADDPPGDLGDEDEGQGDPLVFVAAMSGAQAVPGPGDDDATGRVEIESDVEGRLCFDLLVTGLDAAVTGAHVHEAPAGSSGEVVIDIGLPTTRDDDTASWSDVCLDVDDAVVERLNADPSQFYADVHTETHGDGAVRGQLEQATIFDLELT